MIMSMFADGELVNTMRLYYRDLTTLHIYLYTWNVECMWLILMLTLTTLYKNTNKCKPSTIIARLLDMFRPVRDCWKQTSWRHRKYTRLLRHNPNKRETTEFFIHKNIVFVRHLDKTCTSTVHLNLTNANKSKNSFLHSLFCSV